MNTDTSSIFTDKARKAKHARSRASSHNAEFIHNAASEEIIDRLETVLRSFALALFYGPDAPHLAAQLTPQAGVGAVTLVSEWGEEGVTCTAPPHRLPFPDKSFDLFVSFLTLHRINNVPAAVAEARRLLKDDGLFLAIFPGNRTLHELRSSLTQAESEVTSGVAPRVHPNIAVKDGGTLLQQAGFALPVADIRTLTVSYEQPLGLIRDLRAMGETNALAASPKGALRRDVLARMLALYGEKFSDEEGRVLATFDLVTLTGWVPDKNQPQPLKPGTARVSLAEVFKKDD